MAQIIEITSLDQPGLEVYTSLTQAQLRNRLEPEKGVFIAESPKVPFPAGWGGQPAAVLAKRSGLEGLRFCHASRFLISASDKETALAACRLAQAARR